MVHLQVSLNIQINIKELSGEGKFCFKNMFSKYLFFWDQQLMLFYSFLLELQYF